MARGLTWKKLLLVAAAGLLVLLSRTDPALAAEIPVDLYHQDLGVDLPNEVSSLFPASRRVNPSFIDPVVDPNLHLAFDSIISVIFLDEQTPRQNTLGYFTFDLSGAILSSGEIFPNASALGSGGLLTAGDTLDLGPFDAGTNIGFYVTRNGWLRPNNVRYYSLDDLNASGERRAALTTSADGVYQIFGFEDGRRIRRRSDYNDLLFAVETQPFDTSGSGAAPGVPEPATAMLLIFGLGIIGLSRSLRSKSERAALKK